EQVHRSFSEFGEEPYSDQVKKTVDEPFHSKFGFSVFTGLMLHHFFVDATVSGILGKHRNVTVHFPVYINILYNRLSVSFQATVEIVEFQAGGLTRSRIEELGRQILSQH